jgi:hypothetical protein
MTDDMSMDERPLNLGDLAQTESPEIVRAALGRFRRRLLVRGFILVLAVAAALVLYPRYFGVHGDLIHDIRHGHGVVLDRDIAVGKVHAGVFEVARLGRAESPPIERYGVHVVIDAPMIGLNERMIAKLFPSDVDYFHVPTPQVRGLFEFTVATGGAAGHSLDIWMSLTPGTQILDIPLVTVTTTGTSRKVERPLATIHLDMKQLNVPDWIWR